MSVVGHGCWAAGGLWWGDDVVDDDSVAAMRAAWDAGVNLFDTAPLYGHGHADRLLARALGPHLRDAVIASKCGVRWDGEGAHAVSDLSPTHVRADVEASLRRLGVEHIALMQTHWPCQRGTALEATLATLTALVQEGKIGAFGLCNVDAAALQQARRCAPIATLQTPYSLLRRELEGELLEAARTATPRVGVLAYEPLCRGLLAGVHGASTRFPDTDLRARDDRFQGKRYLRNLAVVSRLGLVARRLGLPVAAVAIAWVLRQPGVDVALVGAKRASQVALNVRAAELLDDAPWWSEVDRIAAAVHG